MKDLHTIIHQDPIYLHDWAEEKKIGVIANFEEIYITKAEYEAKEPHYKNVHVQAWHERNAELEKKIKEWEDIHILFASYSYYCYSGHAFVLFERDGKLFEVNGSHCSCYGLEGQWKPEETTIEALEHRLLNGSLGNEEWADNVFHNELKDFLGIPTS